MKRSFRLTLERRHAINGYLFTLPFIIGFALVFVYPIVQSIWFSLNELSMTRAGYELDYVGLDNYRYAFQIHPFFLRELTETTLTMLSQVFWVLVFSFFASVILNQEFRGRLFARTIFFLPIILAAGIILKMEQMDYMMGVLEEFGEEEAESVFLATPAIQMYLMEMQLPEALLDNILLAIERLPEIIKASGIQILVFLAGLQSIPRSLYEAADVEGSTSWESFWLITLPLLSPLILTNIVYTVVDFFTAPTNLVVERIQIVTFTDAGFGVSSAMAWVYFGTIALLLLVVFGFFSRFVFYQE